MENKTIKPNDIPAEELIGVVPSDVLPNRMPTQANRIKQLGEALSKIENEEYSEKLIKEWKRLGIKRPYYITEEEWDHPDGQLDAKENMIAYMAAWGMKQSEIERGLGISAAYVRILSQSVVFKDSVREIQKKIFGGDPREAIRNIVPRAIQRISETIHDENAKQSTRLAAAQDVLDRAIGRATQKIEVEETSLKKVFETLDMMKKHGNFDDIIETESTVIEGVESKEKKVVVEETLDVVDLWMKENIL